MQKNIESIFILVIVIVAGCFACQNFFGSPSESGDVVIYTANDCPPCDEAKQIFDNNEVAYTEYNINDSEENNNKFKRYHSNNLPLVIIGNEIVKGYDETLLNIAINGLYEPDTNSKTVVIYTKPKCGWCDKARQFLQNNNIDFSEFDITQSDNAKQQFDDLGGHGTPLILIGSNKISGFNEVAVKMALKQVGLM